MREAPGGTGGRVIRDDKADDGRMTMRPTLARREILATFLAGATLAALGAAAIGPARAAHVVRINNPTIRVHGMNATSSRIRVHGMNRAASRIKVHRMGETAKRIKVHRFGDPQTARRHRKRKTLRLRVHAFGD